MKTEEAKKELQWHKAAFIDYETKNGGVVSVHETKPVFAEWEFDKEEYASGVIKFAIIEYADGTVAETFTQLLGIERGFTWQQWLLDYDNLIWCELDSIA